MGNNKGHKAPALTGEDRAEVARRYAARYNSGETLRALADESERSYGAMHALLSEAGVTFRRRGAPRGVAHRKAPEGVPDAIGRPDPNHDVGAELATYDFSFLGGSHDRDQPAAH